MAPGFDQLSDHDFEDETDNIDFSDLKERYDVRMEEGLDTFVVSLREKIHSRFMLSKPGHRWPPTCQYRSKVEVDQVPTEKTEHCWEDKRWRRISLHADE